jgi:hypothetical protein
MEGDIGNPGQLGGIGKLAHNGQSMKQHLLSRKVGEP